jgi:hypothetical protein
MKICQMGNLKKMFFLYPNETFKQQRFVKETLTGASLVNQNRDNLHLQLHYLLVIPYMR